MKKTFECPEIEMVKLSVEDVITTSVGGIGGDNETDERG